MQQDHRAIIKQNEDCWTGWLEERITLISQLLSLFKW